MDDSELGTDITCFIVSPIGSRLEPVGTPGRARYEENLMMWEEVFQAACARFGIEPVRADRIAESGDLTEQIFELLRDADLVIVDLSNANPNVMYELGLRHGVDLPTIQVGEYERLPFDVGSLRTIQFRRTEAGLITLRRELEDSIKAALEGRGSAAPATRIMNAAGGVDAATLAAAKARSSVPDEAVEIDEPGIIDVLAEGERSLGDVASALGESTALIVQMGEITSAAAERLHASDAAGKGFAGRLLITHLLSRDLVEPAADFERQSQLYFTALGSTDAMVDYLVRRLEAEPDERAGSREYLESLLALVEAATESEPNIVGFITSVADLRKASRDLAGPARTIERSGNRIVEGIGIIQSWGPRVQGLLDMLADEER
jgi:hypothetical protein